MPALAYLIEKALKQHPGNSCLNLRTPVHLNFGFIPKRLPRIICVLHLKQDTAGTGRVRVQAREDPGFSHRDPCWDLRRALTLSGRDEEDNPPEKPWLRIRVEMGNRMASTGGEKVSKMKTKTNVELGNTVPFRPGV